MSAPQFFEAKLPSGNHQHYSQHQHHVFHYVNYATTPPQMNKMSSNISRSHLKSPQDLKRKKVKDSMSRPISSPTITSTLPEKGEQRKLPEMDGLALRLLDVPMLPPPFPPPRSTFQGSKREMKQGPQKPCTITSFEQRKENVFEDSEINVFKKRRLYAQYNLKN